MSAIVYTEDAFSSFYHEIMLGRLTIDDRDYSAISSFHKIISSKNQFTENQAKFLIRLMKKYKSQWLRLCPEIESAVNEPRWRDGFRSIDMAKEIFVEVDDNIPWICLKFPYHLRDSFEKEILRGSAEWENVFHTSSHWIKERKLRRINLYNYNILQIQDFVQKNGFKIHESFVEAVNLVEEIWNNLELIAKKSKIVNNQLCLINADRDTEDFFQKKQKNMVSDLLTAKSMGYILDKTPENFVEKIAATEENWFWYKDLKNLIKILSELDGRIVFLLDRSSDFKQWLIKFKSLLDETRNNHAVRVCFRLNNEEDSEFNQWVSTSGFGGKVDEGKFLIFLQKPNKWLFNQPNDVKIIITNSVYPPNDQVAMYFLQSHPCVIFAGDVKPTDPKGKKIVSL